MDIRTTRKDKIDFRWLKQKLSLKNARQEARGERVMGKEGLKFKELRVWHKGKDLAIYIYQIAIKIFKHKNKLNFGDKYGNKSKSEI